MNGNEGNSGVSTKLENPGNQSAQLLKPVVKANMVTTILSLKITQNRAGFGQGA